MWLFNVQCISSMFDTGELLEHEALAKKDSGTVVKRRRTSKTEKELVGSRLIVM